VTSRFFIYGLVDPRTLLVRYVGKTSSGMKRPLSHNEPSRLAARPCHRASWILSLRVEGLRYEIAVLEVVDDPHLLNDAECWWIAFGRACGWDLTNHTDGGEGTIGLKFTDMHRARLREARKRTVFTPERRAKVADAMKRRGIPPLMKERASDSNRRRVWTPEMRARLSRSKKGQGLGSPRSREAVEKTRQKLIGRIVEPETRAKLSAALKGRHLPGRPRGAPRIRINLLGGGDGEA